MPRSGRGFGRGAAVESPTSPYATVTTPSGETFKGAPLIVTDFDVTLRFADGSTRTWARDHGVPEGGDHQPTPSSCGYHDEAQRYRYAQSDSLSGHAQMRTRMNSKFPALLTLFAGLAISAWSQILPPDAITHPKPDSWPTFHGDYSGRHYSPLKEIDAGNVHNLALAWVNQISMTPGANIGGPGSMPSSAGFANTRCAPLLVNGVLYITEPNTVLAIDARTGREIWKYTWKGLPAFALGNRGVGIYGDWLFFETYDNHPRIARY